MSVMDNGHVWKVRKSHDPLINNHTVWNFLNAPQDHIVPKIQFKEAKINQQNENPSEFDDRNAIAVMLYIEHLIICNFWDVLKRCWKQLGENFLKIWGQQIGMMKNRPDGWKL